MIRTRGAATGPHVGPEPLHGNPSQVGVDRRRLVLVEREKADAVGDLGADAEEGGQCGVRLGIAPITAGAEPVRRQGFRCCARAMTRGARYPQSPSRNTLSSASASESSVWERRGGWPDRSGPWRSGDHSARRDGLCPLDLGDRVAGTTLNAKKHSSGACPAQDTQSPKRLNGRRDARLGTQPLSVERIQIRHPDGDHLRHRFPPVQAPEMSASGAGCRACPEPARRLLPSGRSGPTRSMPVASPPERLPARQSLIQGQRRRVTRKDIPPEIGRLRREFERQI